MSFNENLNAFMLGQRLRPGLMEIGINKSVRDPLMYLYNGIQLPPLPEWDKTIYPYALIYLEDNGKSYDLWVSNKPLIIEEYKGSYRVYAAETTVYLSFSGGSGGSSTWWPPGSESTLQAGYGQVCLGVHWSSYDILYANGDLYQAVSAAPTPVYQGAMYSYNDFVAAELPTVDRATYPYVHIYKYSYQDALYVAYYSEKPTTTLIGTTVYHDTDTGINHIYCQSVCDRKLWGVPMLNHVYNSKKYLHLSYIVWANYDVLDENGELYLAASDPISVHE